MPSNSRRNLLIVLILLAAVLLALGNVLCHALVVRELTGAAPQVSEPGLLAGLIRTVGDSVGQRPQFVWFFTGAPILIGIILALLVALLHDGAAPAAAVKKTAPGDPTTAGALRLLALLQQEGRLIDFLEEDIQPYGDVIRFAVTQENRSARMPLGGGLAEPLRAVSA